MVDASVNDVSPTIGKPRRVAKRTVCIAAILAWCVVFGLGSLLVTAVNQAREAARESQCRGHFSQLMMAFHEYHETYHCLPPAFIADENGKPKHSWRVLVLPFLGEYEVYKQYDFSEPWDGSNNRRLADKINLDLFRCPSGPTTEKSLMTEYVVIVGSKTAFPGSRSTTFDEMEDGRENSILVVEIMNSNIHWMEPRDLNFDEMSFLVNDSRKPSISSPHPWGPGVSFADGISTYRLGESLRPGTLQAFATIAGREPVSKDKLHRPIAGCYRHLAE